MSKRGSSPLPMPSRTVKERTTKVKVAGNLNGLSAEATSRSSPVKTAVRKVQWQHDIGCALRPFGTANGSITEAQMLKNLSDSNSSRCWNNTVRSVPA